MGLKIILLKLTPDFPGVNELTTINRGNFETGMASDLHVAQCAL